MSDKQKKPKIRVIAVAVIWHRDHLFVSQGYDSVKDDIFYRAMGGGVKFGESSEVALVREFQEEIQAELTHLKYLGCLENIFTFNGKLAHELMQIYQADFVEPRFYEQKSLRFQEKTRPKLALWVPVSKFESGELKLVPEAFLTISQKAKRSENRDEEQNIIKFY